MQETLNNISRFIEEELKRKQRRIEQQDILINQLERSLQECQHVTEGNKQLINKLLGDLSRKQQDLEWYKRTYETRSFVGVIKELLRKRDVKSNISKPGKDRF